MPTGQRADPLRNFNFYVEFDGITQAGFTDCSGFGATTEPVEVNEGGVNHASHKFVGRTKQNNITLKWGLTNSRDLYDWYRDVVNGRIRRRTGSIVVLDLEGNETVRWNFRNGWPTKWEGPAFTAKGNEVAIETLEIAHEGLERA
ncbi:MAG: phage tail protein [candidate division KSB1 bacterium]|nr:phage tail protein [candidate division KSB1 bacterium]MDZ7273990.1 phage tail protein [candidate division KSB1 bacterium]MDZ7286363.1 phage tail protein [candidate division KSB1 bacterium]MDZ7296591.1 phage tail protein [candidate division KSB1 bacterium]MDZ7347457.1 phage tail protein [candidate division KSB1 bacterium]